MISNLWCLFLAAICCYVDNTTMHNNNRIMLCMIHMNPYEGLESCMKLCLHIQVLDMSRWCGNTACCTCHQHVIFKPTCLTAIPFYCIFNSAGGLNGPPPPNQHEDLEAGNPWAMLLRTFLPWVNAGRVPNYDQEDADDSEADRDQPSNPQPEADEAASAADAVASEEDDLY